jgi:tRNA(Ile2) C34 agmatinyltransferase TiaS
MEVCEDCGGLLIAVGDGFECSECGRTYSNQRGSIEGLPAVDGTEVNGDSEP